MTTKKECPRDYSKGKVYMIRPICGGEDGEIYIGSTTKQYLCQRMTMHRNSYNNWKNGKYHKFTVYDLFDKYGLKDCEIVLIENVNCDSIDELLQREKYHIQNNNCINRITPKQSIQEWRVLNQERLKNYRQEYRAKNIEKIKEIDKIKHIKDKDRRNERSNNHYYTNKEDILKKMKTPFKCICGSVLRVSDKVRHLRSIKHLAYIKQQQKMEN